MLGNEVKDQLTLRGSMMAVYCSLVREYQPTFAAPTSDVLQQLIHLETYQLL